MKIRDNKTGLIFFKCDVCSKPLTESEIHFCEICGKARRKTITFDKILSMMDDLEEQAWVNIRQSQYSLFTARQLQWKVLNNLLPYPNKKRNPFIILAVNENIGDGSWRTMICVKCAYKLGLREGDDLK